MDVQHKREKMQGVDWTWLRHQRSAAHLWASFLAEHSRIANLANPNPAHIENDSLWKLLITLQHRRDIVGRGSGGGGGAAAPAGHAAAS